MTVRIFANKFDIEPHEVHESGGKTICQWLTDNVPSFNQDLPQQFSASLNGEPVHQSLWPMTGFTPKDALDFTIEPKGTELFFGALFALAIVAMTPKIPKVSSNNSKTGDNINEASIKGNKIKLNDVIPDIAGRVRVYPSYLVAPRRFFADPRTQSVQMLLTIGKGDFEVPQGDIKVGETPLSSLGNTASYTIYPPGASVASEDSHFWWHTSEEVGSTSTGNSGLTLSATSAVEPQVSASTLQFNAKFVSVPSGSGWFPVGWAAGMIARVDAPYPLTFTNPASGATVVSGQYLPQLKPFVGMKIEMTGPNGGDYVVASYSPYVPAVAPNAGSSSSVTGNAAPARYDFNVTPVTFNVGGGPIKNLLVDTYSWIASTTPPTITTNANVTVSGLAIAGSSSGFGLKATSSTTSNGVWFMLAPSNNAAGWNIPLAAGTYTVSLSAASAIDGATIQAGLYNGTGYLGTTTPITATQGRYSFTVTVPAGTFGLIVYFNRSSLSGSSVSVHSAQVESGSLPTAFSRGTRVITLSSALVDIAGLVNAANDRLSGSSLVASASSGRLRIAESASPFSGKQITLAGSTSDVFGGSPVTVTGSATTSGSSEQLASMTMSFDDGSAVSGLQTGSVLTGFSYRDMRYRITAVSEDSAEDDEDTTDADESHGPSTITLTRLTDTGAEDTSWAGFEFLQTNGASITLDESSAEGDWAGPFVVCPEGEIVNRIEIDFFFPQGLIRYTEKNGNIREATARVEVQYRDFSTAGEWTARNYSFSAMSQDQQGYTRGFGISAMRAEVRIRRIGAESSVTNRFDRVQWYALKGRINRAPTSYAGMTTMAVYVNGGDRLSTQSEALISCIPTRILPVRRDGAWQAAEPTRDIAPYCLYLLREIGYTDADLDLAEWDRLDAVWRARGDKYDNSHASGSTVQKILEDCLSAGFSELTVERGLLRPVRDEPQTTFGAMYTPQNFTEDLSIKFDPVRGDDYDAVDVEYTDPDSWKTATVPCRLPGDAARRIQKVTAVGVVDRDKAYQIGMRQRRAMKYRRKSYSWSTEMDAFNSRYLDYVQVAGDVPGYAQSALMLDYDSRVITSSEPLDWSVGSAPYYVSVRRADGSNSGPYAATRIDDYRLRIGQELDFVPVLDLSQELPHILFGVGYAVQVTEISPNGTEAASMEARAYDSRVYMDDNSLAPVSWYNKRNF